MAVVFVIAALPAAASGQLGCNSNTTSGNGLYVAPGETVTLDNVRAEPCSYSTGSATSQRCLAGPVFDYGVLYITGSFCDDGSVVAEPGSQLYIQASTFSITGNLRVRNAAAFSYSVSSSATVGGMVNIVNLDLPDASITFDNTSIGGGFAQGGTVGLDLLYDNVASIQLGGNHVGYINCFGDTATPTNGGIPNTYVSETGECRGLH